MLLIFDECVVCVAESMVSVVDVVVSVDQCFEGLCNSFFLISLYYHNPYRNCDANLEQSYGA